MSIKFSLLPDDILDKVLHFVISYSEQDFSSVIVTCRKLHSFLVIRYLRYPVTVKNNFQYQWLVHCDSTVKCNIRFLVIHPNFCKILLISHSFQWLSTLTLVGPHYIIVQYLHMLPRSLTTLTMTFPTRSSEINIKKCIEASIDIGKMVSKLNGKITDNNFSPLPQIKNIYVVSQTISFISNCGKWSFFGGQISSETKARHVGFFLQNLLGIFQNSLKCIELVRIDLLLLDTNANLPSLSIPHSSLTTRLQEFPHLETVIIDSISHRNSLQWRNNTTNYTIFWFDYLDCLIYIRPKTQLSPWLTVAPSDSSVYFKTFLAIVPTTTRLYAVINKATAAAPN